MDQLTRMTETIHPTLLGNAPPVTVPKRSPDRIAALLHRQTLVLNFGQASPDKHMNVVQFKAF